MQTTRWHAPVMCTAWFCSLIFHLGPSGLLHAKTGAGTRDFANSGTDLADSSTDHGCKPMQPRASLLLPTNACPWQPWVKLMLGQSQMHTGCSKTTQEPSKCMQIAPNVVTLFTIEKVQRHRKFHCWLWSPIQGYSTLAHNLSSTIGVHL